MNFAMDPNVCEQHKNLIKTENKKARANSLCALIKYCKNDADQIKNDADPIKIAAIKEELREKLTSIASKLLNSQHSRLEDLSLEDQILWKSFDNGEIYEFIMGEPDTLPEFQYNWIEPCQLAIHLPQNFAAQLNFQLPPDPVKPVPIAPPPLAQAAAPPNLLPQPPHQNQEVPLVDQPQVHQPEQQPVAGPSQLHQHDLRPHQERNYKELHTGIKQRCRKLRRQAKAVVTKLAPGSFSPQTPPPGPSSNQGTSS